MGTKIQINSLEALERLIGGDTDLEIELRNSVVQEFAKRHLKYLANEEIVKKAGQAIKDYVNDTFFDREKDRWGYYKTTLISGKVKEDFEDYIKTKVHRELYEVVDQILEAYKADEEIAKMLEDRADWIVSILTEENLNKRLDKMVDQRLKERLDIKS